MFAAKEKLISALDRKLRKEKAFHLSSDDVWNELFPKSDDNTMLRLMTVRAMKPSRSF